MRHVVIGRSAAGISAAKTIRTKDPLSEITVISGEKSPAYLRPLLPFLLSGQKDEHEIRYPEDPLAGLNINSVIGTALRINTAKKEVILASGEELRYDTLLIAAGGASFRPAIPGIELNNIYPLRNVTHALQIQRAAETARSIVVIGGGLVGIKAALALRERGLREITVIEMMPEILNGKLDRAGAAIVRRAVEGKGVSVLTAARVSKISGNRGSVTGVLLAPTRTIAADLVIVAAGIKPNISWLRNSGIRTNRGVLVNESLRTNMPGVYAAGDVAEGRDLLTGAKAVSGLWSNAVEMGRIAGLNMTGENISSPGFLTVMNASEIAGVPFISAGQIEPAGRCEIVSGAREGYWKLVLDRQFLIGAVFVGNLTKAGIYTNLIKNRIPVDRMRDSVRTRSVSGADFLFS